MLCAVFERTFLSHLSENVGQSASMQPLLRPNGFTHRSQLISTFDNPSNKCVNRNINLVPMVA
jgi:hypothetical protein